MDQPTLVTTASALDDVIAALVDQPRYAIDTEFHRERTYYPKVALVQVAWAEGHVSQREREVVLEIAASRGVGPGSPAHAKLESWLKTRPHDSVFETAMEVLRVAETTVALEPAIAGEIYVRRVESGR